MVFGVGHGISIGSETSGGVHNVTLTNLTMVGTLQLLPAAPLDLATACRRP